MDTKRKVNTSIKRKESEGERDPRKEDKNPTKGRRGRALYSSDAVRGLKSYYPHQWKAELVKPSPHIYKLL